MGSFDSARYVSKSILVPDAEGEALVVCALHCNEGSPGRLSAYNLSGLQEWSAQLPHRVSEIRALDLPDESLLALVTKNGRLYVLDTGGVLVARAGVPGFRGTGHPDLFVYDLCAGQESDGGRSITLSTSEGEYRFDVRP